MLRSVVVLGLVASSSALWGKKKDKEVEQQERNGVDVAMDGWAELAKNPHKMQELMASFKDPEVVARAQEMMNDPVYMAAANKKMAELQAKAQARGMLDANGMPVPGAATEAAKANPAVSLAAMSQAAASANAQASMAGYEMDNLARHRAGELNSAELGMANLKEAMKDPNALAQMAQVLKDPSAIAQLKQMMADPAFQQQAKRMVEQMQGDGSIADVQRMAQQMMAGAGGAARGGAAEAELARLRAENAALKKMI